MRRGIIVGGIVAAAVLFAASTVHVCACGPKVSVLGLVAETAASLPSIDYRASRQPL